MMNLHVEIDRFSGPMALLLHLIRQEEMDIFDINIHQITKQYLESMKMMKKLNLEGAGDFIAMAATLIQIKSRMLLPQYNEAGEVVETEDPRKDLVRRLVEYQMYQEAGQQLYQRPLLNRDVWTRGEHQEVHAPQEVEIVLEEENALYSLIKAYRTAIKGMNKAVHKVGQSLQSIRDRIWEMRDRLVVGKQARFFDLITAGAYSGDLKGQRLITFLSLLELGKMGFVSLFQAENFEDIHVDTLRPIDRDVISQVENYDAANSLGDPNTMIAQSDDVNMAQEVADETARDLAEAQATQQAFDITHAQMVSSEIGAPEAPILDPIQAYNLSQDLAASTTVEGYTEAFDLAEALTDEQEDLIENFDRIIDGSDAASDDMLVAEGVASTPNVIVSEDAFAIPEEDIATDDDILAEEMRMAEEDFAKKESDNGEEV